MKVLVDVSAGRSIADLLRSLGNDTSFVRDSDILSWAVTEGRVVVTMDKDFGELIFRSGQPLAGVLLLRLEAARTPEKLRIVTDIFSAHESDLPGQFSVYQNGRLRIR